MKCVGVLHWFAYKPRTTDESNDETSSPTTNDDNDIVSATQTDSEQSHLDDFISASETTDCDVITPTPTPTTSLTEQDRDSTADEPVDDQTTNVETTNVAARRTQPSVWNGPPLTKQRAGLSDQAATATDPSPPRSPTRLGTLSFDTKHQTDTRRHQFPLQPQLPQLKKSQQDKVQCENGVCRLRLVSSNKQCHEVRSIVTSTAATNLVRNSTIVRDDKSVSIY